MPQTRLEVAQIMRAAAVSLLRNFAGDREIGLTVYDARPRSIAPPHAFIDRMTERILYLGPQQMQRIPVVEVVVLHGLFDSKDATAQRDRFVDGFLDWQADRFHEAGANTTLGVTAVDDDPEYVPTWQPPEVQRTYYATRFSLEGLALD